MLAAVRASSGSIEAAQEEKVSLQRQVVIGALKCAYWLVKQDIAHHTKYESLLQLAKSLGCSFLVRLEHSRNATIHIEKIVSNIRHPV